MVFIYSRKHKLIDWHLAILLALIVGFFSFTGGFISKTINATYMKILFAVALFISALLLLANKTVPKNVVKFGVWKRYIGGIEYEMNIILIIIPTAIAAFLSGMIGISGGGLIVPITVLLGRLPLRIAMGTNPNLCITFGLIILAGSQIGSHLHVNINEKFLRYDLAIILSFASIWMILRIII